MRIMLAPMEGVIDHTMRTLLTALGGIDRCVTEFVRVTDQLLPRRVFYRLCPELLSGGTTPSGIPVYVQLLGGKAQPMAANAARAAALGALGIDLNFGCPAKLVNRNDGGAVLLREPQRIHDIVAAVRIAVPAATPVTAKIRLGYEDDELLEEIAAGVAAAGASELVIHARTRQHGYRPPAFWDRIATVRAQPGMPVCANGEIWTPADATRCQLASGCSDIMLGRGVLACPDLPRLIRAARNEAPPLVPLAWSNVAALLIARLESSVAALPSRHALNPVKQWLGYLRLHYPDAEVFFAATKRVVDIETMRSALAAVAAPAAAVHALPLAG